MCASTKYQRAHFLSLGRYKAENLAGQLGKKTSVI